MKEQRFKKVDDDAWNEIVARMKERERKKMEQEKMDEEDKFLMHPKRFEALEKRLEDLEKKHQDLIENLRIFMVNDDEDDKEEKVVTIGDQLDQIVEDAALDDEKE